MVNRVTYLSFDAFRPHFDMLARVGFYKIVLRDLPPQMKRLHHSYMVLVWCIVFIYNMQHVIRVVEMRHSTDQVVNTLFILFTTLNTLGKQLAFNLKSRRMDAIIDTINGPIFAPTREYHVEKMKQNALTMHRLLKLYVVGVGVCGIMWGIFPMVNRALGEEVHFTAYMPFDTSQSPMFELCVVYLNLIITFLAFAHVTMDCTIVALYAQATVQLRILRYNLQELIQISEVESLNSKSVLRVTYIDENETVRNKILKRFVRNVRHHLKIKWFVKEIESIFAEAMVFQFLVTAWVICMTVYKIVGLSLLSAEFFSMAVYLCCILAQFFLYCFYGTQLKHESQLVNQSLYCGEWLALSPKFRRMLLVMMENCKEPVLLRTAYVVPITLESYIAVLRASYTLFTFLDRK